MSDRSCPLAWAIVLLLALGLVACLCIDMLTIYALRGAAWIWAHVRGANGLHLLALVVVAGVGVWIVERRTR